MLTRPQQILLKRAQAEAGLVDAEYRAGIATISGWPDCTSSKDRRLTDRHLDNLMSYFEAIYWAKVNSGGLQPGCKPDAVFRQRGYWASKNRRESTSRDRFVERQQRAACDALEQRLFDLGYGLGYVQTIQMRITPWSLMAYRAALERTLAGKQAALANH